MILHKQNEKLYFLNTKGTSDLSGRVAGLLCALEAPDTESGGFHIEVTALIVHLGTIAADNANPLIGAPGYKLRDKCAEHYSYLLEKCWENHLPEPENWSSGIIAEDANEHNFKMLHDVVLETIDHMYNFCRREMRGLLQVLPRASAGDGSEELPASGMNGNAEPRIISFEDMFTWRSNDPEIRCRTGRSPEHIRIVRKENGCQVWGPRALLPAGSYSARVNLRPTSETAAGLSNASVKIDVCGAKGSHVFATSDWVALDTAGEIALPFTLNESCDDVEVRFYSNGEFDGSWLGLRLDMPKDACAKNLADAYFDSALKLRAKGRYAESFRCLDLATQLYPDPKSATLASATRKPRHTPSKPVTLYVGIKNPGHDTSIFVLCPELKAFYAVSTERLTRTKHDDVPPIEAIHRIADGLGIDPHSVSKVVCANSFTGMLFARLHRGDLERRFAENALLARVYGKRIGVSKHLACDPEQRERWQALFEGPENVFPEEFAQTALQEAFPNAAITARRFDHEYCHILSSVPFSGFSKGLAITFDGHGDGGEFSQAHMFTVTGGNIIRGGKIDCRRVGVGASWVTDINLFGDKGDRVIRSSLPEVYEFFTWQLGYTPGSDEGKVEALAALGQPIPDLLEKLDRCFGVRVSQDGGQPLVVATVDDGKLRDLFSPGNFGALLKSAPRREDLAATIQRAAENHVLAYVRTLCDVTGERRLVLSGGLFANVQINRRIFEDIADELYIAPAMNDAGTAQGAAILAALAEGEKVTKWNWLLRADPPYFGSFVTRDEVSDWLAAHGTALRLQTQLLGDNWPVEVAQRIHKGEIGAIFHGRAEFGPRALGNRSIVASPLIADIKERLNLGIKKREPFQPFCPSILEEEADRLFARSYPNRHMTCAFMMRQEFWNVLPGAIHVDGTARVQFVNKALNPAWFRVLKEFKTLSGFGVVLNTSFNRHGRTICETIDDAITDFCDTNMSFLVIEGWLITRIPSVPAGLN